MQRSKFISTIYFFEAHKISFKMTPNSTGVVTEIYKKHVNRILTFDLFLKGHAEVKVISTIYFFEAYKISFKMTPNSTGLVTEIYKTHVNRILTFDLFLKGHAEVKGH